MLEESLSGYRPIDSVTESYCIPPVFWRIRLARSSGEFSSSENLCLIISILTSSSWRRFVGGRCSDASCGTVELRDARVKQSSSSYDADV